MTIAIHQPNYLPWLGYFYKIYASDVFVFHDAVAFSTSSFTKRCKVRKERTSALTSWLSVPVHNHHLGTPIADIEIAHEKNWIETHINKIESTYRSAPFFKENMDWLRETLNQVRSITKLNESNVHLIRVIAERLSISAEIQYSSQLKLPGNGSEQVLEIVKHLKGDHYLAGVGSLKYQDDEAFQKAGIRLLRPDFGKWLESNPYDQGTGQFTGGLSIIDALMHVGIEGVVQLFREFSKELE